MDFVSASPPTARPGSPTSQVVGLPAAAVFACLGLATAASPALAQFPGEPAVTRTLYVNYGGEGSPALDSPMAVAYDPRRDEILVANTSAHRVEIFSATNARLRCGFVHRITQLNGQVVEGSPSGLAVDAQGRVLVLDSDACVDVVDFFGRSITHLCAPADSAAPNADVRATAVAVAPDGVIYVAAGTSTTRILRFDRNYRYLDSWGTPGRAPGELSAVTAMAFSPQGELVVVAQSTELAVQRFSPTGEYLGGFGRHEIGEGNFSVPSGVAVMPDGNIWVTDAIRHNLQGFDPSGKLLAMVGTAGTGSGQFLFPSGVAALGDRRLVVSERGGKRYQVLELLAPADSTNAHSKGGG